MAVDYSYEDPKTGAIVTVSLTDQEDYLDLQAEAVYEKKSCNKRNHVPNAGYEEEIDENKNTD